MKWINQKDRLPEPNKEVFIKYNEGFEGSPMTARYTGTASLIKELYENGWEEIFWLDEQDEGWVPVVNDFPFDVPILIEHEHGYDGLRRDKDGWYYWYNDRQIPDFLLTPILKSAKRYLIAKPKIK